MSKQRLSGRDLAQVILVTFLWALCYPLITVAVADAPPLSIAATRALLAGLTLLAVAGFARRKWPSPRVLGTVSLAGLGLTGMGFSGMFLAGGKIGPGLAEVLANVQPLLAAVLGFFVLRESIAGKRGLGLAIGFAGIVVVSYSAFTGQGANTTPQGVGFVLMGACGVAVGNVALKRVANDVDPIVAAGWSLVVGAIPLWILAAVLGEATPHHLSADLMWSTATLALLGTALVSLLWFDLLRRTELVRLNTFTFLTPVFGLAIAAVFLDERLNGIEWLGVALVLAAVAISTSASSSDRSRACARHSRVDTV